MRPMPSTCTSTCCNTGRATATAFVSDPPRPPSYALNAMCVHVVVR
jgi:hypothetical protein